MMQAYCRARVMRRVNADYVEVRDCGRVLRTDGGCDSEARHIKYDKPPTPATLGSRTKKTP